MARNEDHLPNQEDVRVIVQKLEEEGAYVQHPQVALVLVLDTSGSMEVNDNIGLLNEGLNCLKTDLIADELAMKRVQIAIVTFGSSVDVVQEFTSVENFTPPFLEAQGQTPMGEALEVALELAESQKRKYKTASITYFQPWVFLITDGYATDMRPGDPKWTALSQKIQSRSSEKILNFWAVGVEMADMDQLGLLCPKARGPATMAEGKFKELFVWLSQSMRAVSNSNPGEQLTAGDPTSWLQFTA